MVSVVGDWWAQRLVDTRIGSCPFAKILGTLIITIQLQVLTYRSGDINTGIKHRIHQMCLSGVG